MVFWALSENLTKRPLLRNFLHPLNCEEPTLLTAIRLAMDERHRSSWFERDAEGAGLRLNWAGHGERLDEGVGIPGLSGLSDRKSTRLNSSHLVISYAVFCLKNKTATRTRLTPDATTLFSALASTSSLP